MSFIATLSALRQSLVELSKNQNLHVDVVAKQLSDTRFAILQLEGFDWEKNLDLAQRFSQINQLEADIDKLVQKKAALECDIEKAQNRLKIVEQTTT